MTQTVKVIILCCFVYLQKSTAYPNGWKYSGEYGNWWDSTTTPVFTTPEDESRYRSGLPVGSTTTGSTSTYSTSEETTRGMEGSSTPLPPLSLVHVPPSAFRVIWNVADGICLSHPPYADLAQYSIEANLENRFLGDTVALLYDSFGQWPKVDLYSYGIKECNGGLPHRADADSHVIDLKNSVRNLTSPNIPGFGVIDMELWRPLLESHYGRLRVYRQIMMDEVAKTHPNLNEDERWEKAKEIWNKAARYLMERSLNALKFARPLKLWGYYGYPEYSSRGSKNDRLGWLWKATTAFYPSIYIKSFKQYIKEAKEKQITILSETFRLRELYGNLSTPIMAYTWVQTPALGRFYGKWLDLAIKLPAEMGVDGIIIWATSKFFTDDNASKNCPKHYQYMTTTLGPAIQKLTSRMTKCSFQMCGGKGRCVHKDYVDYVFFSDRVKGDKPPESDKGINSYFYSNFVCMCYTQAVDGRCV